MKSDTLISVIVSTYNRPDALHMVLEALNHQTDTTFEVVIADDGSTEETRAMIERMKTYVAFSMTHVWHVDKGFRLAAIRNLAVKSAKGEYLIFLDGDSIPSPQWVERHRTLAEEGWMVTGQRILASRDFTQGLLENPSLMDRFEWTYRNFVRLWRNKKINRPWPGLDLHLGYVRKMWSHNWRKVRGCNWAMWKADYVVVNGSDETIVGWGSEDSDLAVRLLNYGVSIKSGIFSMGVLHLWHEELPKNHSKKNFEVANRRETEKIIYPRIGLVPDTELRLKDKKKII